MLKVNPTILSYKQFAELSEDQKWEIWRARQEHLWRSFIEQHQEWEVEPIVGCGVCLGPGYSPSITKSWPQAFECPCGAVTIADKSLPDGNERFSMFSRDAVTAFAKFLLKR